MKLADLEAFMERNGKDVLSFCKYLTKNKEEAEDLCQDTFVAGYELAERITDEAHAKRFFLSVAVKLWKNRRRKHAWRLRIVNDRVLPEARMEADVAGKEETPEWIAMRREEGERDERYGYVTV